MSDVIMIRSTVPILVALAIGCATALAQEPTSDTLTAAPGSRAVLEPTLKSALTPAFLDTKIKETEAATDLDEAAKTKLTELYRKSLSELQTASALEEKANAYKRALETAPARAKAIREELAAETGSATPDPAELPADISPTELEQRLAKAEADAAAVGAKLAEMEKELESSTTRPMNARKAIEDAKQALDGLEAAMSLPAEQGESQAESDARRWILEARRQSLRSEILMLDQELLSQAARVDLLKAARDKATIDLSNLKASAQELEERLNQRLKAEAEEAAIQTKEAQRQAADKHPLVRDLAQSNAALSDELTVLTEELNRLAGMQGQVEDQTRRITEDFRGARQRVKAAGLSQAMGQTLIDHRNELPDMRSYRKAVAEREKATTDATLSKIRYGEELRRLRDLEGYVEARVTDQITTEERAEVTAQLHELAQQRRELLEQALHTDESYLRALGELDYASSQLIQAAEDYDGFLAERLLWVRSTQPVSLATFGTLPGALLWAIDPANWLEVARVLLHELANSPVFWIMLLTAALLQWKTRAMRRRIRDTAAYLRRISTDDIRYTLEALGLTLLIAVPLPLLLASLGLQLYASLEATDFTKAIGQGAISVSLGVYFLLAFRILCIRGGVADRHFRWKSNIVDRLRRNFDWLLTMLVPLGFVASSAYNHPDETYSGSLGRLSLIVLTMGLAVFFARVLSPERGALQHLFKEEPDAWLSRSRKLWYPLLVATPLVLGVLAAVGYIYTVGTLLASLVSSMYLVLGITVLHQLIERWLVLTRRRLALQAALDRRAARAMEQSHQVGESESLQPDAEEPEEVDFDSLDEQTRRLVNMLLFIGAVAALWAIWSQVLPAFGVFDQVPLWHHMGIVDGEERVVPFTLADVGLVLLIAFVAVVAAKNLPALLEIMLLSRTSMSAGSRYAFTTMVGYIIAATAALTVFSSLGLSWGSVQWLVAALGVGIGFGLQEIVANFISGIIILFERPVRVGDVVTIGDTTGSVSKIRIRATTIRNWEKQELLVPNKEFITGRLLNWTLSDNLNRIVINVGVAYGTDVTLALTLLEKVVKEFHQVLEDPEPRFTLEGFGDNALNLVVRCYLGSMDERLAVTSDLHRRINEKFCAAGISIAFPQRDIHLSALQPLDVRIHRSRSQTAEPSPPGPVTTDRQE
jgi:potassium efflux system protein